MHARCEIRETMMRMAFAGLAVAAFLTAALAIADETADLIQQIQKSPLTSAKDGAFRKLVVEATVGGQRGQALASLEAFIRSGFRRDDKRRLNDRQISTLAYATDAAVFLAQMEQFARDVRVRRDVLEWLAASEARYQLFLNTVSPDDDWANLFGIIEQLYDHDPKERDEYFRLILAFAVVWDQPRPPIHRQMGEHQLPYAPDLAARYDYFRDLYDSKRGEMPYRDLSVTALTFVVDVPVPISELEWARKNEPPRSWDRKYRDIVYSDARLAAGAYQWPDGPYTLAAIKERGGICVDQGYYATICARAWGLPALFFAGEGRRGPHAWIGYMKTKTRWEMDVGRYTFDKYATGHAIDPQSNKPMSDHYVEFTCDRSLGYNRYRVAARYGRLAFALANLGYIPAARQAAEQSLAAAPLYEFTWHVLETMLVKEKATQDLYDLLENMANTFHKYPDFQASIRTRQADLLRQMGQDDKAERLLERKTRQVGKDRDDLARFLANEQIRAAYDRGDYDEAMAKFEDMLKDQKKEGQKIFGLMEDYLALAAETKRNEQAAKFLKRYVSSLERIYDNSADNRRLFLTVLAKAYGQAGDERNLKRVQRDLERLR
jgi:hypothetical protein